MLITSPRKLSVLENFRARHLRPASLSRHPDALCKDSTTGLLALPRSAKIVWQDCFRQPRSANIAQEPQLKLVKIPNASQNAVFNPILRLFLPQNPEGIPQDPGINFKYTENLRQNHQKFQVY